MYIEIVRLGLELCCDEKYINQIEKILKSLGVRPIKEL